MNLKKWKILSVFIVFGLSALFHFIYRWFPSFITSLFFPVNESIWEHNKIIIGSFFIMALIEKIYFKKKKNALYAGAMSSIFCSILVMLVFTPIFFYVLKTKDNIIITLIIYFICIAISEYINYLLLKKDYQYQKEKRAIWIWIAAFLLNSILTYYPIHIALFYDFNEKIYGINTNYKRW